MPDQIKDLIIDRMMTISQGVQGQYGDVTEITEEIKANIKNQIQQWVQSLANQEEDEPIEGRRQETDRLAQEGQRGSANIEETLGPDFKRALDRQERDGHELDESELIRER